MGFKRVNVPVDASTEAKGNLMITFVTRVTLDPGIGCERLHVQNEEGP